MWPDNIPPCGWTTTRWSICPWMDVWVVSTFWRLQAVLLGKCVHMYSFEYLFSIIWGTGMLFSPFPHSRGGSGSFPEDTFSTWDLYLDLLGQLWTPGIPPWASPSLSLGFVIAVVCYLWALSSHVNRAFAPVPTWGPWPTVTAHREPCRLLTSGLLILYLRAFYQTL